MFKYKKFGKTFSEFEQYGIESSAYLMPTYPLKKFICTCKGAKFDQFLLLAQAYFNHALILHFENFSPSTLQ